eukprot:TRINITY_DN394_c0_g1_i16.p1 TRINITY_DN394_c0_g1~~TRINITY_DN394_c0_g1_i16.p1  ORF type:complete len:200 (+),score=29.66 TRINITY_DN394_c0_g1_i16:299-898(+)
MFAETFGKTTHKSLEGNVIRGRDAPVEERYKTLTMSQHTHPTNMKAPTVADTVGVSRGPERFVKVLFIKIILQPIDPTSVNTFWGIEPREDPVVANVAYEKNLAHFYGVHEGEGDSDLGAEKKKQTTEEALAIFYGVSDKKPIALGEPIPGYGGFNRRVQADNLFGQTYGDSKKTAVDSMQKVEGYQSELLMKLSLIHI